MKLKTYRLTPFTGAVDPTGYFEEDPDGDWVPANEAKDVVFELTEELAHAVEMVDRYEKCLDALLAKFVNGNII